MTTNIDVTTTFFVGNHYEVTTGVITKYYYAGSQRIAMRKNGTLNYIIGDHLGSTSIVTDASGNVINQTQYKAWGETRYTSETKQTKYQYTGQYYESDFGLHFYNARWYDSSLSRFAQADTIVPGGVQGYDRYAAMNNNPVKYTDPSGHCPEEMASCRNVQFDLMFRSAPNKVKEENRGKYLLAVAEKYNIHLASKDKWIYQNTNTLKWGSKYNERGETPYGLTPNGSAAENFYNDSNELVEPEDSSVLIFKKTFTECDTDECVAGVMAHEAAHSWAEWLIQTHPREKMGRFDQTLAEELIADQVGLEVSPSNPIINKVSPQHLRTCQESTQSSCLNPVEIWHDYYSIEEIYKISNLVFGK